MSKQQNEIIPPKGSKLFVDIGNSSLKAAYLQEGSWQNPHPDRSGLHTASDFVRWINHHSTRLELIVITSVVADVTQALVDELEVKNYRLLTVNDIPADLIDYETPKTLGLDRFFGCYGAVAHTKKPAVVIDVGSACTIDFMAADFLYRGGVIMPGLGIIEDSLLKNIPALPAVDRQIPSNWPGKSTRTSLQWGLTGSYIDAVDRFLQRYEETFGEYDLFATGGGAEELADLLRPRDVKVRPSLVFEGMKEFLEDYL